MAGGATGCCCTPAQKIGFDVFPWPAMTASCFPTTGTIIGLTTNIARISECRVVFAGLQDACGRAINFTPGQYAAIRNWITGGGRLYLSLEFEGCLGDQPTAVSFLAAMGTAITYVGGAFDNSCETVPGTRAMLPGVANIAQGLPATKMAATAELAGGTNVFRSPSGVQMMQVEKLGSGFLFVCGDGNVAGQQFCLYNNCAFFRRLMTYQNSEII
jgi:hypothetical protein